LEKVLGSQVVAFQGASEWALDYLVTSEAVWIPTESQVRQLLLERLSVDGKTILNLACSQKVCTCHLTFKGEEYNFEDQVAAQAYGMALLHVLENSETDEETEEEGKDIWEAGLSGDQEP
jgi:Uri superfamily endonuclease